MALGTPVSAAVAYSAASGTTVSPAYPAGLTANHALILITGQKPSTANGGTVTTPTGWTLVEEALASGGYGTTLGADTGNTNLRIYAKNTVTGTETGNLAVTLGGNNVSWAFMVRIPTGGGTLSYGSADGNRSIVPTAGTPFTTALTNGASPTAFQTGDVAIWAMCIPTDVTTPAQFTAQSVTATGATFSSAPEFNEPDSGIGNDIGGYSAWASVTAGSSTTAPSTTVTAAGTVTNVRGPIALVRVRETAPPAQTLTPALYTNTNTFFAQTVDATNTLSPALYSNTNSFFTPTVTAGAANLSPARYDNTNVFYTPDVTQSGGAQALLPNIYTNTNAFFAPAVTVSRTLTPALYTNTNAFFSPTVIRGARDLAPNLYSNTNVFYSATVSSGASVLTPNLYTNTNAFFTPAVTASRTLTPALYANTNAFFAPAVSVSKTLTPALYTNTNTFFSASVIVSKTLTPALYTNTNAFFAPTVGQISILTPALYTNTNAFFAPTVAERKNLAPALYNNTNNFFAPTATATYALRLEDWVDLGYVDQGYIGLGVQNTQTWYVSALTAQNTITPTIYSNVNAFFAPTVTPAVVGTLSQTLGAATVSANGYQTALGAASISLDPASLSASGEALPFITAALAVTLSPATVSADGIGTALGTSSSTLEPATVNGVGFQTALGTLSTTLDPATVDGVGFQTARGSAAITLDPATVDGVGFQTARGSLAYTLAPATLVAVGVPTPATATLTGYLAPILFSATAALTTSPAAPTFHPIIVGATVKLLKAAAAYKLISPSAQATQIKATGQYRKYMNAAVTYQLVNIASLQYAAITVTGKTVKNLNYVKIVEDSVTLSDVLNTGVAPKIDTVATSTVGYGLMQDYVDGDYFAEDYTGSSFTF